MSEEQPTTKLSQKQRNIALGLVLLICSVIGGALGGYAYDYVKETEPNILKNITTTVDVKENSSVIDAVNKVNPAVVSITGISEKLTFFGGTTESKSSGTGFVVSSDGVIVTNKHVVSDTSTTYTVYTSDGKNYDAVVKAIDPIFDIAILKVDAQNLTAVALGTSANLQPGQTAIAIGNALGQYQNSVTVGVISAVGRAIQAGDSGGSTTENLENVIQTDAAINPGNSGGPLINIAGQVVGVNTAVDSTGQSIGFAIPVELVKTALESYLDKGKIVRPMLGVRYISLNKDLASSNDLPASEGALLYSSGGTASVVSGGPADKAGLKDGDIIIAIGGDKITPSNSLVSLITKYKVGDSVNITYLRDKKESTVPAILVESK